MAFTLSKLIHNAWFFLLAARHRMQALSALTCCVGCAFSGFASLKIALFIQPLKKRTTQFLLLGRSLFLFAESTNRIIQYNSFRFIHQSQKFFHDAKILQRNTVCNNKISLNECNPITTYWYFPKNELRNIKSKALSRGYPAL